MKSNETSKWGIPSAVYQTLIGRLVMVLLLALSVGLLWGSVSRLQPVSQALQKQTSEIARLTDEVQQLEMGWNAREAEEAETRFQELQDQLFDSPEACAEWREQLMADEGPAALQVRASQGQTQPVSSPFPDKDVAALPVTIEIRPLADADAALSSYRRMLNFTDRLMAHNKRMDLTELTVQGLSNSVNHAKIELQLWTREVR
jgi:hypothetical protein